ncbi:MAG TPA: AraC family transcriptional regulator [Xanthobacteraceae bacterium]|jgi:AraC family transcriptional regulator
MGESAPIASSADSVSFKQARTPPSVACAPVEFTPPDIAQRDITRWNGIAADSVAVMRREPYEYRLHAACHLLIMAERAERDDGETLIEGLPKSTRRKISGRLSFVPGGHRFCGWQKPRLLTRVTYFYIDPRGPLLDPELHFAETEFKPRLFFHDPPLWAIASRLKSAAAGATPATQQYAEALSILLAHELLRLNRGGADAQSYLRGGLAAWQRTRVAEYIEEHLAEGVLLSGLAAVVQLSPFHFARAFKHSFGLPPLRYLASRRIKHAKDLLAGDASVTQVGRAVGFAETSSFTTAFRKHVGMTPTAFRRGLE